jgi:lysozyme
MILTPPYYEMANPLVIDISHWQPTPDFAEVKLGGTIGVILKATEGTSYQDPTLYERASAAKKVGLLTSTYHFMRPGAIYQQMEWYLNVVDPVYGERLCLDHEDSGVSLADLCDAVDYLLSERPDLQVTIYSGHVIKEQLGNAYNDYLAKNTSLWIAHYTSASEPIWPSKTWPQWSLWQHTDKGSVRGIEGYVDANRFNGTEAQCIKWLSPATDELEPFPPDADGERVSVKIDITGPEDMIVSVDVNGERVT